MTQNTASALRAPTLPRRTGVAPVLFALFLGSGFCGLLYQVVWLRLAFASFGIITPVLSVLVSVFMAGLALGSWAAGRLTVRGRTAILLYGLAELVIGASAFAVPRLFKLGEGLLLSSGGLDSGAYLLTSGVILAAVILPACFAMGTTFPLAMAYVRGRAGADPSSFSSLYLANVVGAAAGTLLTAVVLIESYGFRTTLAIAACVNLALAAISLVLFLREPTADPTHREDGAPGDGPHTPTDDDAARGDAPEAATHVAGAAAEERGALPRLAPGVPALTILFASGFTSIGLEVIWTRAFTPVLDTVVYSFALLLFTYLVATFTGSLVYRRHLRRAATWSPDAILAALAVASLLPVVLADPRLTGGLYSRRGAVLVLASIAPFCALLGYLTPLLIDRYARGRPREAGLAYAINVVGCILGPLLACYLVLPGLGARWAMLLFALPFPLLFLHGWGRSRQVRGSALWRPLTLVACLALTLTGATVSVSLEEGAGGQPVEIHRDHTATVVTMGEGRDKRMLVNGAGITEMTPLTKVMAHLPLGVLEEPRSLVVICFGMGTTFRSALSWGRVRTTAVELAGSVPAAFPYYHDDAPAVLADPLGRIVVDDGRRFLARTDERFDVITIDPPPPIGAAGSSLLYSTGFYEVIRERLNPGGMLLQWCPRSEGEDLAAVMRSLVTSFPELRVFRSYDGRGIHVMASNEPLEIPDADTLLARMPPAARADLVEWNEGDDRDPLTFLTRILAAEIEPRELLVDDPQVVVTDDRPFTEYYWMRRYLRP